MIIRNASSANTNLMLEKMMNTQAKFYKTQEHAMALKKILSPSDDALGSTIVLKTGQSLANIESFYINIDNLDGESSVLDTTYGQILEKLDRLYELSMSGANGTNAAENTMQAIYDEVASIKVELVRLSNTQHNGNYIFSGNNVARETYTLEEDGSIVYHGTPSVAADGTPLNIPESEYARKLEVSEGTFMAVNYAGDDIFGFYDNTTNPPTGRGMFKMLADIETAMNPQNFNQDDIRAQIDKIEETISHISTYRTKNGVNMSRLELIKSSLEENKILLTQQKSNAQDLDAVEAYSSLTRDYQAYQASLQISSQMVNTSLLNYI